ncbi:PREDICTED: fas-binding factor 1 homolog, partial [Merops nubicus]|uniref:fas-binding factor 1 homolog n=1 Tax=Merops nubicus TaxID=57421 RepID=UPI0004F0A531
TSERKLEGPRAQLSMEISGCEAALHSSQDHVAELERQVRTLEQERTQHKGLLESLRQRHQEDLDHLECSFRSQMKVQEETSRQREERLRWEKEQLEAQLLSQRQDAVKERAEHQEHLAALRQQHMLELERVQELPGADGDRASVEEMRQDYEEPLRQLKWLKDQEVEAVTSAMSYTRSLKGVTEQVEKFSCELRDLMLEAKAMQPSVSQELVTEAWQQDGQLRELQDRLLQQQKGMEEDWRQLQEAMAKMKARLREQTQLLERERCRVTRERSKAAALQHSLEQQHRVLIHHLSVVRAELETAKSALMEEQELVLQTCLEAQRNLSAKRAECHTKQQLSKEWMELKTSPNTGSGQRDVEEALQMDAEREATVRSLAKEQAELKIRGCKLKAKEEEVARDRELLEEAWRDLRLEKEKVNWMALRVQQQQEELQSMTELLSQRYEEEERAFWETHRRKLEWQTRLRGIQRHVEQLNQQEQQLHQEQLNVAHRRRRLEQLEHEELSSLRAQQDLGAPRRGLSSTW